MTESETDILEITDPDSDRYATMRLIDWWDQARLAAARVLVAGAGALGNEAVKNLALLGVGQIVIVDFDQVEYSNLSRSVLLRAADSGQAKAAAVAARTRELNPEIEVIALHGDLTTDLGLGVFRRMDVVLGCLDNREARLAVNRACRRVSTPWIDGGLDVLDGLVRVFVPGDGPCYECTLSQRDYALLAQRYGCPPSAARLTGRYPTTATAAAIIAAMQVQEALKLLHGLSALDGRGAYYSGQTLRMTTVQYPVRSDCPAHERYTPVLELPVGAAQLTLDELLARTGGHLLALDQPVLTYYECPNCQRQEPVFRPYHLSADRIECPRCGSRRLFDIAPALPGGSAAGALTLAQLGVPLLHIVRVRSAQGWHYVELTGDAEALFNTSGEQTNG